MFIQIKIIDNNNRYQMKNQGEFDIFFMQHILFILMSKFENKLQERVIRYKIRFKQFTTVSLYKNV